MIGRVRAWWHNLFLSAYDGQPVTIGLLLARDSVSRLLSDFNEHELDNCKYLILIHESKDGVLQVEMSDHMDTIYGLGLIDIASNIIKHGGAK